VCNFAEEKERGFNYGRLLRIKAPLFLLLWGKVKMNFTRMPTKIGPKSNDSHLVSIDECIRLAAFSQPIFPALLFFLAPALHFFLFAPRVKKGKDN